MTRPGASREQGFVLLLVLWTLVPLSLLVSGMLSAARTETRLAANVKASAIVEAAADGGIRAAIMWLLHNETADGGTVLSLRIGAANVAVRIDDEAGKLNPNVATVPQLAALLRVLGESPDHALALATTIADWRSPSAESLQGGLKVQRYRTAGRLPGPGGRPFRSIDDLALVPDMSPALLARLRPYLCLYLENGMDPQAASGLMAQVATDAAMTAGEDEPIVFRTAEHVLSIRALAEGPDHARFARHAIVRLRAVQGDGPLLPQVLTWEDD